MGYLHIFHLFVYCLFVLSGLPLDMEYHATAAL